MVMDLMKFMGSPEAEKLVSKVKDLINGQGLSIGDINNHLARLESAARSKGKTIKQVCDESMDLYERS